MRKTMVMALPGMDKVCIGLKEQDGSPIRNPAWTFSAARALHYQVSGTKAG